MRSLSLFLSKSFHNLIPSIILFTVTYSHLYKLKEKPILRKYKFLLKILSNFRLHYTYCSEVVMHLSLKSLFLCFRIDCFWEGEVGRSGTSLSLQKKMWLWSLKSIDLSPCNTHTQTSLSRQAVLALHRSKMIWYLLKVTQTIPNSLFTVWVSLGGGVRVFAFYLLLGRQSHLCIRNHTIDH